MDKYRKSVLERQQCPQCGKVYKPILMPKPGDTRLLQDQFPDAPAWQREQLITGVCSDECWERFVGGLDETQGKG